MGVTYSRSIWLPAVIDAVLVLVFVLLGRRSHEEGLGLGQILSTAWPFLVALAVGWALVLGMRWVPTRLWPAGVLLWIVTVAGGLGLRILSGDTAQLPFVLVTTGVLAAFLLLPRLILHRNEIQPSAE